MTRTCLVLGAGGFIGASVTERLLAEGWLVRGFDRPGVKVPRPLVQATGLAWVAGDFQDGAALGAALEGVDAVVHLVSTTLPKNSNEAPIHDVETNLVATLRLLSLMVDKQVRRIVYASSGGTVYGIPRSVPIREDHPTQPEVSYGITKLAIEKYLYLFGRLHGLRPVSLRIANPYGGLQRIDTAQGAVAAFLHRALRGEAVEIWGDGSVTRDYLHVNDVATAFACALRYEGAHQVFNIGSGHGVSLNELAAAIEAETGRPLARQYLPGRNFDVPVSVLDNSLARAELGWSPAIGLAEGLRMTAAAIAR
ncbi:NAD-dependent epimerase/dehydratase family protein [Ramlibacter sp. USB13]|uniref:UDP-glucose 4-epimerase n=1 Tax=Ramlibacter cellulosilyticus TaxID=2764187 RepID=A0A923SD00_9BURK|nr:NAD-dependent epimerase/dehydratase family protein [Ramlibacter cellulosilyticus]MBC5785485.1 NAD-dependent epimerase/dehydratase family protein [Ramlibacter cellulosilyticus]